LIRVADYVADFIYRQGVSDVFMLAGGGSIYLDDGIACHKHLKPVFVRNEATAPMMAEAYARLTQNLGVVYVTTGPGGANAVTGVVEAWVDSAPVLVVSGQVQTSQTTHKANIKNFRTFGTQELNIVKIVDSITKYAAMVDDPNSIRYHLEKAVYYAKSGRPGPVWLDIPLDVQAATVNEAELRGYEPKQQAVNKKGDVGVHVEDILRLLRSAKRPLIVAGQGIRISKALVEFRKLVEHLGVPVICSRLGQDILPFSFSNYFGHGGTQGSRFSGLIMKESDLVLSLGSRLAVPFVGADLDAFSEKAKVVMVDIDEAELRKPSVPIYLPINADVKAIIDGLLRRLVGNVSLPDYADWLRLCQDYKAKYPLITTDQEKNPIDLYYFVSRLDAMSGANDIFVNDAGSSYYVSGQALKFEKGQREITSGAFASMGLAIPLAIGCSRAMRDARVLAVTGDGSLELNIQELKTMSSYHANVKLFVINNGGYVSIRNTQSALCGGRYIGSDQVADDQILDFQKVAAAFDLPYFVIQKYEEVDDNLSEILSQEGPAFVEVVCDNYQKIIKPLRETNELHRAPSVDADRNRSL